MPPRVIRKKSVKIAPANEELEKAQILRSEWVPVRQLQVYYKNPNVGDMDSIVDSLDENAQYKGVTVNVGTLTGRKNEVLAGNHTMLGARHLGWDKLYCTFIDVSEARAAKIVSADNATAKKGTIDADKQAELLAYVKELTGNISGTGFTDDERDEIYRQADRLLDEAAESIGRFEDEENDRQRKIDDDRRKKTFDGADFGDEGRIDDDETDDAEDLGAGIDIKKQGDELDGAFRLMEVLNEDDAKNRVGYWGIPRLRTDMLMTFDEIPENIKAWAGSATKDWPDEDQWWLYNYGIDSTSGMKDVSKVVVSFYAWDEYFEGWYYTPSKYFSKLLNSGIKYMINPNYSQWGDVPQIHNLWALYRARYVARYAQEVGVKVMPDIVWPMGDIAFLKKHILATLPKHVPCIAIQLNTFDKDEVAKQQKSLEEAFTTVFDTLEPQGLLIYGSSAAYGWFENSFPNLPFPVKFVESRLKALGDKARTRQKKTTI